MPLRLNEETEKILDDLVEGVGDKNSRNAKIMYMITHHQRNQDLIKKLTLDLAKTSKDLQSLKSLLKEKRHIDIQISGILDDSHKDS